MSASVHIGMQVVLAGADSGKAGPLGLLVVVLLGIACYFLFKSMSGHLRKVQNGFDTPAVPPSATPPNAFYTAPHDTVDEPRATPRTNRTTPDIDRTTTDTNITTTVSDGSDAQSVPKRSN